MCERLAMGETLTAVCKTPGYPSRNIVYRWIRDDVGGFKAMYMEARDFQIDGYADEVIDISDYSKKDKLPDGRYDHDHINRDRLKIDTRKWVCATSKPQKYSLKTQTEVSGPQGGPVVVASEVDKENIARWLMFLNSQKEGKA